mgnify:FL=1
MRVSQLIVKCPEKMIQLPFTSDMTLGDLKNTLTMKGVNADFKSTHLYFGQKNLYGDDSRRLVDFGLNATGKTNVIYATSKFVGGDL